jgi:hypothetical protein
MPSVFNIKKCKKTLSRKLDQNCLVFAKSHRKLLRKAIGQPWTLQKRIVAEKCLKGVGKPLGNAQIRLINTHWENIPIGWGGHHPK